jgi:CBS domain-containing protein
MRVIEGWRKEAIKVNREIGSPVVTVGEETGVGEIARLLTTHGIKRVPVVRDGRIVGIVSRADLVRTLAEETLKPTLEGGGMHGARPS